MLERISKLLEPDDEAPHLEDETCSHCIVAASIILPDQAGAIVSRAALEWKTHTTFDAGVVHAPRGPPVGATGPPLLQLI